MTAQQPTTPDVVASLSSILTELLQKLEPSDLAPLATAANQTTGNTTLTSILAKLASDPATNTTLAQVLAKISSDPATNTTLTSVLNALTSGTTHTDLSTLHTDVQAVVAKLSADPATNTTLAALFATEHADLAAILAKDEAILAILAAGIGVTGPLTDTQLRASPVVVETGLDTDLAAVLAKLSSDPATQTTLAAVLAKLSSDPATQTTLAALVSANHSDLAAVIAKNEAIRALVEELTDTDFELDDAATETTAAAILAKLIAAPATEAKQDTANTALAAILAAVDGLEGYLDGVEGKLDAIIAPLAGDGRKTVTTAGTAVAFAGSTACKWVSAQPLSTNTDKVAVGTSTVLAASGFGRGFVLSPGDPPVFIPASNLASVFVDSRVNGEGVAYSWGA